MVILDSIVSFVFVGLATTYFIINAKNNNVVSEENIITFLFSTITVAYCFLFAHLGFINVYLEAFVAFPYLFLSYSGTKATLRLIHNTHRCRSSNFDWLYIRGIIFTGIFLFSNLMTFQIALMTKNNFFIMITNLTIIIYLFSLVYINCKVLLIENKFYPETIFTNPIFIACTISLYESIDFITYLSNLKFYSQWNIFYKDPTHYFDIIWILACVICFGYIPRLRFSLKNKNLKEHKIK